MNTRIMKLDLRLWRADRTLWVIVMLFVLLFGYGVFNGARWTQTRARQVADLQQRADETLAKSRAELAELENSAKPLPTPAPAAALPTGKNYQAVLPPATLSALAIGQSDLYPYTATIDIYAAKHALFNFYEQDNPLNLLAGRFDLAFVLIFLFPLLIIALTYNLLSAEREGGTLQLTLAQPVTLRAFVFSKVTMRLLVVLALAVGVSLLGILLSRTSLTGNGTLARLLLFVVAVTAYALFWFALAILVNAFGKSSIVNAVALVALWLLLVVVAPSLLNLFANAMHPVPSRLEYVSKIREADNYTRSYGQKLLAEFYGDHPELTPEGKLDLNDFTVRFYTVRQENQRRVLPAAEQFDEQLGKQQRLINAYRYLSPAVVMQDTLNDIAGTSRARQQHFVSQLHTFVDRWQEHFVPLVFRKTQLRASDYDAMPRFQFQEEATATIARRVTFGLLGLLAPTPFIGLLAFMKLRRYPVVG